MHFLLAIWDRFLLKVCGLCTICTARMYHPSESTVRGLDSHTQRWDLITEPASNMVSYMLIMDPSEVFSS